MITPMTPDASGIDTDAIRMLVEWQISAGSTGLFVVCTSGEMFSLSDNEMVEVARTAVQAAAGRIPIIAGLPFPDVEHKVAVAQRYAEVGVQGAVSLQPYESPADDDSMYEHYARLADATTVPLLIYEQPRFSGTHLLSPSLVGRLAAIGRYIGMKDCTGDIERLAAMADAGGGRYGVMQAVQEQLISGLLAGGSGACCTGSNAFPQLYRQLYDLVESKDIKRAYAIQEKIRRWIGYYGGHQGAKLTLNLLGLSINTAHREEPLSKEGRANAATLAELIKELN